MNKPNSQVISSIPTVDVSGFMANDPAGTKRAVDELRFAMENVGFFFLIGHGVDWSIVEHTYAEAKRFFDQPLEKKMEIKIGTGGPESLPLMMEKRGYLHYGGGSASKQYDVDTRSKNYVESMNMAREEAGKNQWPSDLPGFQDSVLVYYDMMFGLATDMLRLYAGALDLPNDYFLPFFREPAGGIRLSHYLPAASEAEVKDSWGSQPHTDRSFLTLLPANKVDGLQVRPEGTDWSSAPYVPKSFVVNGGDVLRRWTNDRFLSTPHRVTRSMSERYAMPFFFLPDEGSDIKTVPSCIDADHPDRYASTNSKEFLTEFFSREYKFSDERLQS